MHFIDRDVVYNEDIEVRTVAEIIIGKNRHGASGNRRDPLRGPLHCFENLRQRGDGPPQ